MSGGEHQHETDCSQVIHQIFTFIDNEMDQADCAVIQKHLDECGPCLAKYDLERTVKSLVQRSCSEQAPNELREKVLVRIREVQVSMSFESDSDRS
jgi:mycothiol system anti-sigma-R factor